jgi:hypothetical protein
MKKTLSLIIAVNLLLSSPEGKATVGQILTGTYLVGLAFNALTCIEGINNRLTGENVSYPDDLQHSKTGCVFTAMGWPIVSVGLGKDFAKTPRAFYDLGLAENKRIVNKASVTEPTPAPLPSIPFGTIVGLNFSKPIKFNKEGVALIKAGRQIAINSAEAKTGIVCTLLGPQNGEVKMPMNLAALGVNSSGRQADMVGYHTELWLSCYDNANPKSAHNLSPERIVRTFQAEKSYVNFNGEIEDPAVKKFHPNFEKRSATAPDEKILVSDAS